MSPELRLSNTRLESCNFSLEFFAALLLAIRAQAAFLLATTACRPRAVAFLHVAGSKHQYYAQDNNHGPLYVLWTHSSTTTDRVNTPGFWKRTYLHCKQALPLGSG